VEVLGIEGVQGEEALCVEAVPAASA
jgi:hypothetical protein